MELTIRKACISDITGVYNVETSCFPTPWSLASITYDIFENPLSLYVVAEEGDSIIGFCGLHCIYDEGHIMNLAVLEEYRGTGAGEKLLRKLIELAPPEVRNYTLEVRKSNIRAISLYKKLGFKIFGVRRGYYSDNDEDALIMWLKDQAQLIEI